MTRLFMRRLGSILAAASVIFVVFALIGTWYGPALGGAKDASGQLLCNLTVREKLISAAYKVYGAKDQPISLWLAKSVFKNDTPGYIKDLKVRYKLGEFADWCPWQTYPSLLPTQTVVDLYYPILSEKCARLANRTPAELQMECEYLDSSGRKQTLQKSERLTVLGRQEIYFGDLSSREWNGTIQDSLTYGPLLAAWVTKTDLPAAGLAALGNKAAGGVGAYTSVDNCIAVLAQLYEMMRRIHITYQFPAGQVERDRSFDIRYIQTVQYPRDVIQKRSGTCIDLAILYAAMMEAVGIPSRLVATTGHVFPIAVLPNGLMLPVEATGVGGGGTASVGFADAVKIAEKEWQDLQANGQFVMFDCQSLWGAGVSSPELDPLPADILERWGITEAALRDGGVPPQSVPRDPGGAGGAPPQAPPLPPDPGGDGQQAVMVPGNWVIAVTNPGGSQVQGVAQVAVQGNRVQMVSMVSYPVTGPDGKEHRAQEQSSIVGQIQGQRLEAQCSEAVWTLDGTRVQPKGLPYKIQLTIASGGRAASGTVINAEGGSAQLSMQLR
ncbi:MAG: transglutaminase-like domain-containing protein [Acidobacteria bacterium]|nr:transglutaminase-like domain-containing protein [Acidobacteriota bacterium]